MLNFSAGGTDMIKRLILAVTLTWCSACAEVGSERWCNNMEDKPKGDWTANETADYARHCIFD